MPYMRTIRPRVLLALTVTLLFLSSCVSQRDRAPERDGYVVHAYHYCEKCRSLQGGVYEKGPFKAFPGENKKNCIHEWQEISRERFFQRATERYDVDWSKEPALAWHRDAE